MALGYYLRANWHIKASKVSNGAAFCCRVVRACMIAVILLVVECGVEFAA